MNDLEKICADAYETLSLIHISVKNGQPVLKRISTVTGDAVKNPSNILYLSLIHI